MRHARELALGVVVAIVMMDSSIVTLGLPDVLRVFDLDVEAVSQVLTSFNAALAITALPAALIARRAPRASATVGILAFAAASAVCATAGDFDLLIGGRIGQAVGGALALTGCLALMKASGERGAARWVLAGILGAALGPAVGGILTDSYGWEAIFLFQVPVAVFALAAALAPAVVRVSSTHRIAPDLVPLLSLALVAAALAAALFLLVLLMIEAWGMSPRDAGLAVSFLPVAAVVGDRLRAPWRGGGAAAAVLAAAGVSALGILPDSGWPWTVAPQILVGIALGLAVGTLGGRLMQRSPVVVHGAWSITARHAGIVLGLALLSPVLAADLVKADHDGLSAGTAVVLDAPIPPGQKLTLARELIAAADASTSSVPDLDPVFATRKDPASTALANELRGELERAATHAFSHAFLLAGLLGLAALVPLGLSWAWGRR